MITLFHILLGFFWFIVLLMILFAAYVAYDEEVRGNKDTGDKY